MPTEDEPLIVALYRHNTWANLRLLDACAALTNAQLDATVPGTFGSIRHTLTHLIGNEENYLGILTGWKPEQPLRRGEMLSIPDLRAREEHAGPALTAAVAALRMTDILHPVWQGEVGNLPAPIIAIQVINHATEHRTHIATILTQQGITPPAMDGWTYDTEGP